MPLTAERLGPADWERSRAVRLRALAENPDAFASLLADELAFEPECWRTRLANPDAATFVVPGETTESGAEGDLGVAVGAPYRDGCAGLFAMWVALEARGRGVGDALIRAVIDWARAAGYPRLLLDVAAGNEPAIRLYERHGFRPTGAAGTLPPPREHVIEHEYALDLPS